jgi:hypothetical protein
MAAPSLTDEQKHLAADQLARLACDQLGPPDEHSLYERQNTYTSAYVGYFWQTRVWWGIGLFVQARLAFHRLIFNDDAALASEQVEMMLEPRSNSYVWAYAWEDLVQWLGPKTMKQLTNRMREVLSESRLRPDCCVPQQIVGYTMWWGPTDFAVFRQRLQHQIDHSRFMKADAPRHIADKSCADAAHLVSSFLDPSRTLADNLYTLQHALEDRTISREQAAGAVHYLAESEEQKESKRSRQQ